MFAHKDNILYSQGFGFENKEKSILNSIDTKFNLASMNKMFTSLAIAILEEQEKLSFNYFVNDFIVNFPFGKITIHQLLTHTSGIGDFFNERFLEKRTYLNNLSDYLPLFINDKPQFEPGTRFQYSNGGYIILGLIIEKVSNLSYFDFVKKYIFKPLEMNETDSFEIDRNNHQLAIGYTHFDFDGTFQPEKKDNLSFCAKGSSAGGGFSTVNDLWKFAKGLYNNKLISSKQLAKITSEKENIDVDEKTTLGYGYGFFVENIDGYRIIGHDGGFPGVSNRLDIYPDDDYTFIVLSNDDGSGAAITRAIRKIITSFN